MEQLVLAFNNSTIICIYYYPYEVGMVENFLKRISTPESTRLSHSQLGMSTEGGKMSEEDERRKEG